MNNSLLKEAIELAKNTQIPAKEICAQLNVSERWLYKVISGEIKNPGVNTIQHLHNLLTK